MTADFCDSRRVARHLAHAGGLRDPEGKYPTGMSHVMHYAEEAHFQARVAKLPQRNHCRTGHSDKRRQNRCAPALGGLLHFPIGGSPPLDLAGPRSTPPRQRPQVRRKPQVGSAATKLVSAAGLPDRWQNLAHDKDKWRGLEATFVSMVTNIKRPFPVPAG